MRAGYLGSIFASVAAVLAGETMGLEPCGGGTVLRARLESEGAGSVAEACRHHRVRAAGSGPGPDLACPCVVPCVVEQRSFDLKTSKFQALARVSRSGKETTSGVGACQSCE